MYVSEIWCHLKIRISHQRRILQLQGTVRRRVAQFLAEEVLVGWRRRYNGSSSTSWFTSGNCMMVVMVLVDVVRCSTAENGCFNGCVASLVASSPPADQVAAGSPTAVDDDHYQKDQHHHQSHQSLRRLRRIASISYQLNWIPFKII